MMATLTGELIPAPTEKATTATAQAIIAKQEAAQKRKAEQLAERLRQLGVNPNELDEFL